MSEHTTTQRLQECLARLEAGDEAARDELFTLTWDRLLNLTHKILHGSYARVRPFEETEDVAQNARLRLMRALESVVPKSVRDFYGLASLHIRRELLDLCRHYFGRPGHEHKRVIPVHDDGTQDGPKEQSDTTYDPHKLAVWTAFHERVDTLPDAEREVVELLWYQELTQEEAAEVLNVDRSTVKRRWLAARLKLAEVLQPGPAGKAS
jgi:RNA polymerase sigma-70 factor (ECF subfamily)